MSEEQFWKCTPIKLNALFAVHKNVEGLETENNEDYIDNIMF